MTSKRQKTCNEFIFDVLHGHGNIFADVRLRVLGQNVRHYELLEGNKTLTTVPLDRIVKKASEDFSLIFKF